MPKYSLDVIQVGDYITVKKPSETWYDCGGMLYWNPDMDKCLGYKLQVLAVWTSDQSIRARSTITGEVWWYHIDWVTDIWHVNIHAAIPDNLTLTKRPEATMTIEVAPPSKDSLIPGFDGVDLGHLLNQIFEKLAPWYRVKFVYIGSDLDQTLIDMTIAGVGVTCGTATPELKLYSMPEVACNNWGIEHNPAFVARLNAILKGAKRDDAGNLIL